MDIKQLTDEMHRLVESKGWYAEDSKRKQTPRNLAVSLSIELDERTQIDAKWKLVWEIVNSGAQNKNLQQVDLTGANLQGADLSDANLSGAQLDWANLSQTNLSGANLGGTDLGWANFQR